MFFAQAGASLCCERNRDSMPPRLRLWRWLIPATRASLPCGLRGRVEVAHMKKRLELTGVTAAEDWAEIEAESDI